MALWALGNRAGNWPSLEVNFNLVVRQTQQLPQLQPVAVVDQLVDFGQQSLNGLPNIRNHMDARCGLGGTRREVRAWRSHSEESQHEEGAVIQVASFMPSGMGAPPNCASKARSSPAPCRSKRLAYCSTTSTRRPCAASPLPVSCSGFFSSILSSAMPAPFRASRTAKARSLASSSFLVGSPLAST